MSSLKFFIFYANCTITIILMLTLSENSGGFDGILYFGKIPEGKFLCKTNKNNKWALYGYKL